MIFQQQMQPLNKVATAAGRWLFQSATVVIIEDPVHTRLSSGAS